MQCITISFSWQGSQKNLGSWWVSNPLSFIFNKMFFLWAIWDSHTLRNWRSSSNSVCVYHLQQVKLVSKAGKLLTHNWFWIHVFSVSIGMQLISLTNKTKTIKAKASNRKHEKYWICVHHSDIGFLVVLV